MEAVYFAFGLLAVALVIGILLKRSAPQNAQVSELGEDVSVETDHDIPARDDFKHITALRESVAAREDQERIEGSVLLSSGVNSEATLHIREMVTRLQSLSGTPSTQVQSQESN